MRINLTHGNGGQETAKLINEIFMKYFSNDTGTAEDDSAILPVDGKIAFTTDSYVVKPIFFSGGDIGRLCVCGTVNDLLTSGATPKYISAAFVIEEGFLVSDLERIARSMQEAALEAGVKIVTGDTKVVDGNGGIIINTSGIGQLHNSPVSFKNAGEKDALIVTGTLGDHHACIMSARMGVKTRIKSDAAPLNTIVLGLMENNIIPHGIRDITRGGLATCLNEVSSLCRLKCHIFESLIPVSEDVLGLCKILGLDPLYMANEGKMLIAIPDGDKGKALEIIKSSPYGKNAAIIGELERNDYPGNVILTTAIGGKRSLPPLIGEALPRIC